MTYDQSLLVARVCLLAFFSFAVACAPIRESSTENAVDFVSAHGDRKYTAIRISLEDDRLHYVKCENVSNLKCFDEKSKDHSQSKKGFRNLAEVESFIATYYGCMVTEYRSNFDAMKAKLRDDRNYVVGEYSDSVFHRIVFFGHNLNNGLSAQEEKLFKMLYFAARSDKTGSFCKK